eukprot:s9699_g1.t1
MFLATCFRRRFTAALKASCSEAHWSREGICFNWFSLARLMSRKDLSPLLVSVASPDTVRQEPLTRVLAGSLRGKVPRLSSQHVANCLLTISRLSLASEEFAALLAALQDRVLLRLCMRDLLFVQARLLRKDVSFEVQQLDTASAHHVVASAR